MIEERDVEQFREAVYGVAPVALRAAVTLGVIDSIGEDAASTDGLARATGTAVIPLRKLLRVLAARGVLCQPAPDYFALTELGKTLVKDHPSGLREWLDSSGIGARMDRAIGRLEEALTTGQSPYREANGRDFYDDVARPDNGRSFDQIRSTHTQSYAAELANTYPWPEAGVVVDVGGGTGTTLAHVLRRQTALQGVLLDLPDAVATGIEQFDAAGLTDRFTPAPGDFFEYVPPGGHVYLLVNVLHNWSDEQAMIILRNCAQACAAEGGEVLIGLIADEGVATV